MRPYLILIAVISFAPAVRSDEPAKAESLTAKEIADGWILLFDGETTFGWTIEGEAMVEDGALILGGTKATKAVTAASLDWEHAYSIEMETRWEGTASPTFLLLGATVGLPDTAKTKFVKQAVSEENPSRRSAQQVYEVPAGSKLFLRNIKYRPRGLQPLFNGKDLVGWKQFTDDPKRAKSKFTVTKEGWLNVTDGPGDLQTEKQFDDFVLQLHCISNGKNLNSGVFFRCLPGQYQNGYEAQIQNGYKNNDRTKPTDYGTGAIYRRQPARKVVSNDHEWFTMTVIAHGNHMATWVNGYQVTDFTDKRPADDNPRNGSKTGKGAISIQGHDPTTNLSFRNIRIAELPKPNKN